MKDYGVTSFQMSLDGLRETHDKLRKKGSFDATIKALSVLKDTGLRGTIMATVSRLNYQELPDLVDVVVKSDAVSFSFARYCPTQNETDVILTPEEYKAFLGKMWDRFNDHQDSGTHFHLKDHLWKLFLYEKGLLDVREEDMVFDGCGCGITSVAILPNGQVFACRRFVSPIGNVPEQKLSDIFLSEECQKYRDIDSYGKCNTCELKNYCRGCHAVSAGVTGNFFAPDPCCWK